jgi:hypothetical protein
MDFDYDVDKDSIKRFKHRLPLLFGKRIFDDPAHVIVPTIRIGMRKNGTRQSVLSTANSIPQSMYGAAVWSG